MLELSSQLCQTKKCKSNFTILSYRDYSIIKTVNKPFKSCLAFLLCREVQCKGKDLGMSKTDRQDTSFYIGRMAANINFYFLE